MSAVDATPDTRPSLLDVLMRASPLEGLRRIPHVPCARTALLGGIASGATIGAIQLLMRRGVATACNYAVGTFVFVSICGWESCRRARAHEMAQMHELLSRFQDRQLPSTAPAPR